jgi:hypothetical protein
MARWQMSLCIELHNHPLAENKTLEENAVALVKIFLTMRYLLVT